jgi:hypothetical protein
MPEVHLPPHLVDTLPVLGSIICTPATAKVGEPVFVRATKPGGGEWSNNETVEIAINGAPGSAQHLVWRFPGTKQIVATASRPGHAPEQITSTIEITAQPAGTIVPWLRLSWSPEQPTTANLIVDTIALGQLSRENIAARHARLATVKGTKQLMLTHASPANKSGVTPVAFAVTGEVASGTARAYDWKISDGTELGSLWPVLIHDFLPHLDPHRPYTVFHVQVTVHDPVLGDLTTTRSVTLRNHYQVMKVRGVLQPPVMNSDLNLTFSGGAWRGKFTVWNPEAFPLQIEPNQLEWLFDDENDLPDEQPVRAPSGKPTAHPASGKPIPKPRAGEPSPVASPAGVGLTRLKFFPSPAPRDAVTLKPQTTTDVDVQVTNAQVPDGTSALVLRYGAEAPDGTPARVTVAFDLPELSSRTISDKLAHDLAKLVKAGYITEPHTITAADLQRLVDTQVIPKLPALPAIRGRLLEERAPAPPRPEPAPPLPDAHTEPDPAVAGKSCDPWNLPDVVPDGLYCMPTAKTTQKQMPPRFMNARKGDIILSPGGGGLIAAVLAAVSPPQAWSHSGMMTRNRDEITHSTAAEDRLTADTYVNSGGIRPDALTYLWPGVICQTVKETIEGSAFTDPETGDPYTITGFTAWANTVAAAMVVKPDPLIETPETRLKLHGIADWAWKQIGKSYYSFYSYTAPAAGIGASAPPDAKWATGLYPTVCSAFVWMAVRQSVLKSGATIEGALEPKDMAQGAQIRLNTPDGLYLYTASERLNAGYVIQTKIEELVAEALDKGGAIKEFVGGTLWDMTDIIANQVLNTFATNNSDDADETWKQAVDADAVSPQNLMWYDAPLYGYAEPLIYRSERVEEVTDYVWTMVAATGTVMGQVSYKGQPVAGAAVQITEALSTFTDKSGNYTLKEVPVGEVIVYAEKVMPKGVLVQGKQTGTVEKGADVVISVDLTEPPPTYRRVMINGVLNVAWSHWYEAANHLKQSQFNAIVDLDPADATHAEKQFDCQYGGEALGRLYLSVDQQPSGVDITFTPTIRYWDNGDDSSDDYDEAGLDPILVKAGKTFHCSIYVDGGYGAYAWFDVTNELQPS